MAYLVPSEFVTKMVDAGESKIFMSTRDTIIRAYMAGAILALAAAFAVSVNVSTGVPIVGAALFPVGFCMLYLFGFDLLTGVFVLAPLALIDKRPGVTIGGVLRNWGLVFIGNFAGAFTVAVMMSIVFTFGFTSPPDKVRAGDRLDRRGTHRRLRGAWRGRHADAVHPRHALQLDGFGRRRRGDDFDHRQRQGDRDVDADHAVLLHDLRAFHREHVPVPVGLLLGGKFTIMDYLIWNEIPTVVGNLVGGLAFTGLTLYATHVKDRRVAQRVGCAVLAVALARCCLILR